jgi:hypothetical protein
VPPLKSQKSLVATLPLGVSMENVEGLNVSMFKGESKARSIAFTGWVIKPSGD